MRVLLLAVLCGVSSAVAQEETVPVPKAALEWMTQALKDARATSENQQETIEKLQQKIRDLRLQKFCA